MLCVAAVAAALHPVFLAAAAIMVVAFALARRLRDVPLRETAAASDRARGMRAQPRTVNVR